MGQMGSVEVLVKTRVSVSKEDAERALKIVEWYMNDSRSEICNMQKTDGTIELRFVQEAPKE